ncbi:MAG: hypothetical protein KDD44_07905, partial [Bdellovibrionales bacterium]|nr:hypothetical protein [Bdellovibrionales bacterium]
EIPIDDATLRASLNGLTPAALYIRSVSVAADDFDARFSPHWKEYCYRLIDGAPAGGTRRNRAWWVPGIQRECRGMICAARDFVGQHDFSAFRASDCTATTTVRTILMSEVTRVDRDEFVLSVIGTGFLKQMVRIMVGTLVEIGRGRRSPETVRRLLATGTRTDAGQTAPPWGLTLRRVQYVDRPIYRDE